MSNNDLQINQNCLQSNTLDKLSFREELRVQNTISLIPTNYQSILDVGCGDGRITNLLSSKCKYVCGLDKNEKKLKLVKTDNRLGSLDSLPFENNSFGLVICCEVLEHLPIRIYKSALIELERVASKNIFISVPYREILKNSSIICPYCGCIFNSNQHVRSFNENNLTNLFPNFRTVFIKPIVRIKEYPDTIIKVINALYFFRKKPFPYYTSCPLCGYSELTENTKSDNPSKMKSGNHKNLFHSLAKLIPKVEKEQWIAALYERK